MTMASMWPACRYSCTVLLDYFSPSSFLSHFCKTTDSVAQLNSSASESSFDTLGYYIGNVIPAL